MTESSLTRLTRPKTSRPGSGFNAIEECDPSVPAHGILMRAYREIMHGYSNSKTSRGQNVRFAAAPRKREARYRLVYHVGACVGSDIPHCFRLGRE